MEMSLKQITKALIERAMQAELTHHFVVVLENQDFSQVLPAGRATNCSSSGMPYLCGLAATNGTALYFYSNAHGSLLAYLYKDFRCRLDRESIGLHWQESPVTVPATIPVRQLRLPVAADTSPS
jgi:hypothetical protein